MLEESLLLSTDGTKQFDTLKNGGKVVKFRSYDDFAYRMRHVQTTCKRGSSESTRDARWAGSRNWAHNLELVDGGWKELTPKLLVSIENIEREVYRLLPHPDVSRDYTGETFDIGEYISGEPEYWRTWTHLGQEKPTVSLAMNCSMSWTIDVDTIIRRGSAIIALGNALALLGYPVQVTVLEYCSHWGSIGHHATVVPVKNPGEIMDYARCAYAIAHPSMLRRSCFRVQEWPVFHRDLGTEGGYGSPAEPDKETLAELLDSPKHTIYFPGLRGDDDATLEYIKEHGEVGWVLSEVKKIFGEGSDVQF